MPKQEKPRYGGLLPVSSLTPPNFHSPSEPVELFAPDSENLAWDKLRYAIRFPTPVNFCWALREVKDFLGCNYSDMAHNCAVHRYTLRQWLIKGRSPPYVYNRVMILESFLWCVDPNVVYVTQKELDAARGDERMEEYKRVIAKKLAEAEEEGKNLVAQAEQLLPKG